MPFPRPSHVLVTIFLSICLTAFTSGQTLPPLHYRCLYLELNTRFFPLASGAQRPLKRISHPSTLAIEIYPRTLSHSSPNRARAVAPDSTTLHHSDSFRLTLTAFGETFHLHLRPNDQLVHPSARIVYYDTNPAGQSVLSHTEPLVPSSIKAYWGEVVPSHASEERMRTDAARAHSPGDVLGWARITVHDQGDARAGRPPVFEGAFSVRGINHHVITRDSYLRNRDALDPHPLTRHQSPENLEPESESESESDLDLDLDLDSGLVIWRDSDVMDPWEEHAALTGVPVDFLRERRSLGSESEAVRCGHDALPWNSDPVLNPVLRQSKAGSWYNGFESVIYGSTFTELLMKRDDIAGSGMNTKSVHRCVVMSALWFSCISAQFCGYHRTDRWLSQRAESGM